MNTSTRNSTADKRNFAETLKSARLGIAEAQYEVGLMYANGIGVTQSIQQAVDWIKQAAKQGLPNAQFLLATRYEAGVGVDLSVSQALLWFSKAAEQGHMKAVFRLGNLFSSAHTEDAANLYQSAAHAGLPEGQYAMGRAYAGGMGVGKDPHAAAHWFRAAAEQGLPAAQFALADMLYYGIGIDANGDEALFWYRKSAGQNHVASQVAIHLMEQAGGGATRGTGRSKRKASSVERRRDEDRWVRAAESGNADARYHLGQMYEMGLGFDANPGQAERWYRSSANAGHASAQLALARLLEQQSSSECVDWYARAANSGDAQAQFALGRVFCAGELVPQDYLKGTSWYVKAADQGHSMALVTLGNLCNGDMHHVATGSFAKAAEAGSAQAQYLLGVQYATGRGAPQDLLNAFFWYERAASQGWVEAQTALGVVYRNGLGVERDFKQALYWLQRAAEKGDAQAQWNVGAMFASGEQGVARDLKLAFIWCQRAAEQNFVAAQANLGVLYALLKDPQQAVAWWSKAVEKKDPEALYNLALALLKGEGVAQDLQKGFEMLLQAASRGVTKAQSKVGLMYATGEGAVVDPIEAHKWFAIAAAHGDDAARSNLARSEALCGAAQILEAMRRVRQWEGSGLSGSRE